MTRFPPLSGKVHQGVLKKGFFARLWPFPFKKRGYFVNECPKKPDKGPNLAKVANWALRMEKVEKNPGFY